MRTRSPKAFTNLQSDDIAREKKGTATSQASAAFIQATI